MPERLLIAGLGNPGRRYAGTRHNIGFMVVDRLADEFGLVWRAGKGEYLMSGPVRPGSGAGELLLLKPVTYMNNSGLAVRQALDYFKFDPAQLLVVLDDFQLPFGRLRLRPGGSAGGHNGLSSIIQHLGTPEFARLRLGIGAEFTGDPADFVLSAFSASETEQLPALIATAVEAVLAFALQGVQHTMNKFN